MANNGKTGEKLLKQQCESKGWIVKDVSNNPSYWYRDIDFIIENPQNKHVINVECKWDTRINQTGNLYLQVSNIHSKNGNGWFNFCEADYLAYGDAVTHRFYMIKLDALRKRLRTMNPNKAYCGGCESVGLLVNLKDIADIVQVL